MQYQCSCIASESQKWIDQSIDRRKEQACVVVVPPSLVLIITITLRK